MIALPLVTYLNVQVVNVFLQFLGILQEDVEDVVVVVVRVPAVPSVIIAGGGKAVVAGFLLGLCEVTGQVG